MARSIADLRLVMQVIAGPDGRDPEFPPALWLDTAPVALPGCGSGTPPGYPSFIDTEIQAGTDALAAELQQLGVTVEDLLPDPALAQYGQVVEELWPMLVSTDVSPAPGSAEPSPSPLWNYLAALDRRDRLIASWERYFTTYDAFITPAMPMRAWRVDESGWRVDTGEPTDGSPQAQAFVALLLS
jgi:amidase